MLACSVGRSSNHPPGGDVVNQYTLVVFISSGRCEPSTVIPKMTCKMCTDVLFAYPVLFQEVVAIEINMDGCIGSGSTGYYIPGAPALLQEWNSSVRPFNMTCPPSICQSNLLGREMMSNQYVYCAASAGDSTPPVPLLRYNTC